jgi:hypothetical protein
MQFELPKIQIESEGNVTKTVLKVNIAYKGKLLKHAENQE